MKNLIVLGLLANALLYDNVVRSVRFGSRDYDENTGRWVGKDPIGFNGGDENLYAYVNNDPINAFDPTGNGKLSCLTTISACIGCDLQSEREMCERTHPDRDKH